VIGKFEKILKHFRNFPPIPALFPQNAGNRWDKNFKRRIHGPQLRLGVSPSSHKIGA